jgi:acyl carrier protein
MDKSIVRDYLTKLANRDVAVGDDDPLLATKVLDSLRTMELVAFLQERFGIVLDADDITPANLDTVNAIAKLLERKGVQ